MRSPVLKRNSHITNDNTCIAQYNTLYYIVIAFVVFSTVLGIANLYNAVSI